APRAPPRGRERGRRPFMSLMDLIAQAGGSSAAERLGARAGLSPEQTQSAMAALTPSLAGGFRRQVEGGQLERTLATAKPGAEDAADEEAASRGNDILGQIFGSKDVSRSVAQDASAKTGIGVDQLKAFLPMLASLAAGALSSNA